MLSNGSGSAASGGIANTAIIMTRAYDRPRNEERFVRDRSGGGAGAVGISTAYVARHRP